VREDSALTPKNSGRPRGALQIPPLRYAPVGMTILFGTQGIVSKMNFHADRSITRISCHAALDMAACAALSG